MNLKQTIRASGFRQAVIAARLGVSAPTVSRWAVGARPVPTRYIRPLATLLDIAIEDLVPDCDPAPTHAVVEAAQ